MYPNIAVTGSNCSSTIALNEPQLVPTAASTAAVESPARPSKSRYIPELDGVRGVAILVVMLFHFGSLYAPSRPIQPDRLLLGIFHAGWIGVDLFFVLSGFLITGILLDAKGSKHYFKAFYLRRVLRIFPLYYAVLLFVLFVLPFLTATIHHPQLADLMRPSQQIWYWLHLSNWVTAFNPHAFLVTGFWTLSVEEQFYLIWPLIILRCPERHYPWVFAILIAAAAGLRNIPYFLHIEALHDNFMYRLTPFRFDPLVLGALLAVLVRRADWQRIASRVFYASFASGLLLLLIVLMAGHAVLPQGPMMIRFGYTSIGLLCFAFVAYAFQARGSSKPFAMLLRWKALTSLGAYSYGIYVFHGMVLYYLPAFANHFAFISTRAYALSIMLLGMFLSYLVALCSYQFFERHFLRLKRFAAY